MQDKGVNAEQIYPGIIQEYKIQVKGNMCHKKSKLRFVGNRRTLQIVIVGNDDCRHSETDFFIISFPLLLITCFYDYYPVWQAGYIIGRCA